MVDRYEWDSEAVGHALGKTEADHDCSDKARSGGCRYDIEVVFLYIGLIECGADNRNNKPLMLPRCKFGDNSAVVAVHQLRADDVRYHMTVAYNRGGGFITACFYSQNIHLHNSFLQDYR